MPLDDIHAGPQSQPATEGGENSAWPIEEATQTQSSVLTPRRVARSIPATWTTGALTSVGPSRLAYNNGLSRISRIRGLILCPDSTYRRCMRTRVDFGIG